MARVVTAGETTAAKAQAPALAATAGLHVGVPLEAFSVAYRGHTVSFQPGQRIIADTALKALVVASDKACSWES
jgi:hypothetical protein